MSEGEADSDEGVFQFFIRFVSLTDFPPGEICPPPPDRRTTVLSNLSPSVDVTWFRFCGARSPGASQVPGGAGRHEEDEEEGEHNTHTHVSCTSTGLNFRPNKSLF